MPGFEDLLNQVGQVIGAIGGNVLNAVNMAGAIQHGGLPTMLAQQTQLRDDPAFRLQVGQPGFLSALQGGMAGLGFPQIGPDPNTVSAGYGNQGQLIGPTARTNLPPLSPYAQAQQAHDIRQASIGNLTPEQAAQVAQQAHVGQAGGPSRMMIPTASGNLTFGGQATGNIIPAGWNLVHDQGELFAQGPNGERRPIKADKADAAPADPNDPVTRYLNSLFSGGADASAPTTTDGPAPVQVPAPSPGAVKIPLDDAAMGRVKTGFDQMVAAGQMTPQERDQALQDVQNDPNQPSQGRATAPVAAAPVPAQAPAAPQLPQGHVPVGDIKAQTWGDYAASQAQGPQIGYPSPAFDDSGAAPQATPTQAAMPATSGIVPAPTAPRALPPGMTLNKNLKTGATTVSMKGPTQRAVPAISTREMSNMANAAAAADAAIKQIQAGPQANLTVMGRDTGVKPPGLAGPVMGRALGALTKVSGQPAAVEEAQLRALIDHAKTGITAIFGQRLTKENRDFIEALLPDATQPTNILLTHLNRLSTFYRQQVELREVLQNLTPEQRQAFMLTQFHQTMMNIPTASPTTTTTQPELLDLR